MSTRSQIWFYDTRWGTKEAPKGGSEATAVIYHHCDGYPTERLPNIKEAFDASSRNDDMSDVAAWYVKIHKDGDGNVYIDHFEHGDLAYAYEVWFLDEPMVRVRDSSVKGSILFEGTLAQAWAEAASIEDIGNEDY